MNKRWDVLSSTQGQFVDYINENLKEENRIIYYKHLGHFGLDYAISSRYKKIEIFSFKELKNKTGKHHLFRFIHIFFAVGTFILKEINDVDARATISEILNNMENIYLGIDKEKEYLKYLNIRKFTHKYGPIHFAIRVEEADIESGEDIQCLGLLCKLIESGKITNTLLLISGENLNLINFKLKRNEKDIPLFQLTEQDLRFIAKHKNLPITDEICQNIELVQRFGLHFFIDNYNHFDALTNIKAETFDWINKMEWIIKRMLQDGKKTTKQIYPLLEFASFFEKRFSKLEVKNFNNNKLEAENLSYASELEFIEQERAAYYRIPTYTFKLESFKYYFSAKYFLDLEPSPKEIYQYFRELYPFEFIPALKLLHITPSFVSNMEKNSLAVLGYYYQYNEKGHVKYKDFSNIVKAKSTADILINLYEYFRERKLSESIKLNVEKAINGLVSNALDSIATCAGYVMILQFLKENYIQYSNISFGDTLSKFKSCILNIEKTNYYNQYWIGHFMCQYIALSLEEEAADDRTARRFLDDINKMKKEENFSAYISDNHLRGFTRIDLLAFSLGADNAGEIIRNLFISSEESTILKELARINYGAYLIENALYQDAEKILGKGKIIFLQNINIDTFGSYLNNLYLAQLKNRTISQAEYIFSMNELILKEISYSDKLIMVNNLSVVYLMEKSNESQGEEKLKEIILNGNSYNRFLAIHNLLSYYFIKKDVNNFNKVYDLIYIPKLLLTDKTFFLNKFKWMKENIKTSTFENYKPNPHVAAIYNQQYIMSSIERWFE